MVEKVEQPVFGLGGWTVEWIGAIVIYLVCMNAFGWGWFKITSVVLLALFWGFWFADFGNWPFNKLPLLGQGIVTTGISMILGWLSWEWLAWTGWAPHQWAFPVILVLYFLFLVVSMCFENAHLEDLSPPKSAFVNFVIYFFGTWLILTIARVAGIGPLKAGIPAHWFPIAQFYFLCLGAWVTRKMEMPARGIVNLITVLFVTFLWVSFFGILGVPTAVIAFNPELLAWVALISATGVPIFVFLTNYPWKKLPQPGQGIAGLIAMFVISAIEMVILHTGIGMSYTNIIALSFSAVAWEFFMAFQFNYGVPEVFETL